MIRVQKWDNTIATLTPYYLMTKAFRNWQNGWRTGKRTILRNASWMSAWYSWPMTRNGRSPATILLCSTDSNAAQGKRSRRWGRGPG